MGGAPFPTCEVLLMAHFSKCRPISNLDLFAVNMLSRDSMGMCLFNEKRPKLMVSGTRRMVFYDGCY